MTDAMLESIVMIAVFLLAAFVVFIIWWNPVKKSFKLMTLEGVQSVLSGPLGPPYNGKFLIADHIRKWNNIVENNSHACIVVARNHSKTIFASFSIPIWKMASKDCSWGAVYASTGCQAHRIMGDVKDEIENNPEFPAKVPMFPERYSLEDLDRFRRDIVVNKYDLEFMCKTKETK